jgi:hypothetical protein
MDGPVMREEVRNNERVMFDDRDLAYALWDRLRPLLPRGWRSRPAEFEPGGGTYDAVGLNERFRFYRYHPGQRFQLHRDGYFRRSERELSMLTLLVYLDGACEGGETMLLSHGLPGGHLAVKPKQGLALLFRHELLHEGAEVLSGVKHVMRSDVMYRRYQ